MKTSKRRLPHGVSVPERSGRCVMLCFLAPASVLSAFAAGPEKETQGLFGKLQANPNTLPILAGVSLCK